MGNDKQKYNTATYKEDKEIKRALRGIRKEYRDEFDKVLQDEPPNEEIQMRIDHFNKEIKEIRTLIKGLSWYKANRVNRQIDDNCKSWDELFSEQDEIMSKPPSKRSQFEERRLKDLTRIMNEKSLRENADKSGYSNYEDYQREQVSYEEQEYEDIDSVDEFFKKPEEKPKKSRKDMYSEWEY